METEIAHFIARNGRERIICVIASGVPNATDQGEPHLECFPRPLRFKVDADGNISNTAIPISDRPLAAALAHATILFTPVIIARIANTC